MAIRPAHVGLVLFFAVFAASASVLVTYTVSPHSAQALALDERVPAFSLPDTTGMMHEMDTPRMFYRVLVYMPNGRLNPEQQKGLSSVVSSLAESMPIDVVAITNHAAPGVEVNEVCPCASMLLVDQSRTTWQITGADEKQASICVIGKLGELLYRSKLPPDRPVVLSHAAPVKDTAGQPAIVAVAQVATK